MAKLNSGSSYVALSVCHMAGTIDLAALPLWVGGLIEYYHLTPPQAGMMVTLFLGSVVLISSILAPRFNRLKHRYVAVSGFLLAALSFLVMSGLPVSDERLATFLILHSVAGLGVGAALSVTHGCIGRTKNPHRLFGIVNVSMGALAIAMFAVMPGMIRQLGGQVIFTAFAITVGISAIYALLFFPTIDHPSVTEQDKTRLSGAMPPVAWMIIGVVICLTLSQSMVFSFVERIGVNRGFESTNIQAMFVIMGFVNLLPGILAALMQKRLSPISVSFSGPVLQALAALTLTSSSAFLLFAIPVSVYVTLAIFTHTFLFGLLSRIDPSGRAVAATPAMMMIGSASGPLLGGLIVSVVGYHGLGWGVAVIACVASTLTFQARTLLSQSNRRSALTSSP